MLNALIHNKGCDYGNSHSLEMTRRISQTEGAIPYKNRSFWFSCTGTAVADSDIDTFSLIKKIEGSKRKERVAIGIALHDIHVPKDIIVASPEEVCKMSDYTVGHSIISRSERRQSTI